MTLAPECIAFELRFEFGQRRRALPPSAHRDQIGADNDRRPVGVHVAVDVGEPTGGLLAVGEELVVRLLPGAARLPNIYTAGRHHRPQTASHPTRTLDML